MWAYVVRRVLYNVPVYLAIVALLMAALRINDPVYAHLGKNASEEAAQQLRESYGLADPFVVQYGEFLWNLVRFDFSQESWAISGMPVGERIGDAIIPTLSITLPALALTTVLSLTVAIVSAYFRGRFIDKTLMLLAVLGMSVSFLVYVIFGQYWGAFLLTQETGWNLFAVEGYRPGLENWAHYCLLPVLISTVVAMGYDTRFYRAVMVEESNRDYIVTAMAKGASKRKIMFVHMLKNAMIPIITRIMITLPFLIMGSLLLEVFFGIPGMGQTLYKAITDNDFPVTQAIVALFAALFIATNILTDVLYALVDPRVRLS